MQLKKTMSHLILSSSDSFFISLENWLQSDHHEMKFYCLISLVFLKLFCLLNRCIMQSSNYIGIQKCICDMLKYNFKILQLMNIKVYLELHV